MNSHIVIQRNQFFSNNKGIADKIREKGYKIIYEIDDNFWELHKKNPCYPAYCSGNFLSEMQKFIDYADYTIVSTAPLKEYFTIKKFTNPDKIIVMENKVIFPKLAPSGVKQDGIVNMVYAGSSSHHTDWDDGVIHAVKDILNKYAGKVKLNLIGFRHRVFHNFKNVVELPWVEAWKHIEHLNSYNFDIGLIPVKQSKFNRAKSNLKWVEYSACKIAPIASYEYPYYTTIKDDVTGIVCGNNFYKEWYEKLQRLIEDTEYRQSIIDNAYNEVYEKYNCENPLNFYKDFYNSLCRIEN